MRRLLKSAPWIALTLTLTACSDVQPRACEDERDCFGGELCRDGTCTLTLVVEGDAAGESDAGAGDCRLGGDGVCGAQVCNVSSGLCEGCQRDLQCGEGRICDRTRGLCDCSPAYHDCGGTCVRNDSPASCGSRCEPCPGAAGGVATCADGACGVTCTPPYFACGAGCDAPVPCVECTSNSECDAPAAARCEDGFCAACLTYDDCAHLDDGVCSGGNCVQCTTARREACGNYSCNPATLRCTETPTGSLEWCHRCVADSECPVNHRCIAMTYRGDARPDGYCLVEADDSCLDVATVVSERDSLSGVAGEFYCVIREDLTTCEAVKDFKSPCTQDSDCGVEGLPDGLCRIVDGERVCTYRCASNAECANGTTCVGNPPDNSYCMR